MPRLIDADDLYQHKVVGTIDNLSGDFIPGYVIAMAPTIDAEPVRHGKWKQEYYQTVWYGNGEPPEWICSECEDRAYNTYDYCPNCGAKMDLEEVINE